MLEDESPKAKERRFPTAEGQGGQGVLHPCIFFYPESRHTKNERQA